jgi:hypothetical protein
MRPNYYSCVRRLCRDRDRDRLPPPTGGKRQGARGYCDPLMERIPTRCQFLPTLGKTPARYTCKPPRTSPVQAWSTVTVTVTVTEYLF